MEELPIVLPGYGIGIADVGPWTLIMGGLSWKVLLLFPVFQFIVLFLHFVVLANREWRFSHKNISA